MAFSFLHEVTGDTPARVPVCVAAMATPGITVGNTETVLLSVPILADVLRTKSMFRILVKGITTKGLGGATSVVRVRIGPTTLTGQVVASHSFAHALTPKTDAATSIEGLIAITVDSVGILGEVTGQIVELTTLAALDSAEGQTSVVSVYTTIQNLLEVTYISGASNASYTPQVGLIEVISL